MSRRSIYQFRIDLVMVILISLYNQTFFSLSSDDWKRNKGINYDILDWNWFWLSAEYLTKKIVLKLTIRKFWDGYFVFIIIQMTICHCVYFYTVLENHVSCMTGVKCMQCSYTHRVCMCSINWKLFVHFC